MPTDPLESLTPAQQEAVCHVDGPLLILAGPGSGKTRVVTHRVAHLLQQDIPARNILALTFTNKAADEMRQRLERMVPQAPVWMGTFHRFCARLLRRHAALVGLAENYSIYDSNDSLRALKHAMERLPEEQRLLTPEQTARGISKAKNGLVTAEAFRPRRGSADDAVLAKVYPAYQRHLLQSNAADFDDLLLHVATLLRDHAELRRELDERYQYVLVDEYQDTNLAQYAIVRALSIDHPNLAVTGDPDQSIYGWRGANVHNILDFEKDYPNVRVVRLEQNYRSTQRICRVADQLIANNLQRKAKSLFTANDEGEPVRLVAYDNEKHEADDIAAQIHRQIASGARRARDFAVFYRVNALSRLLEQALSRQGVPFQVLSSLEFYQRKEVKDVLAYLQLINNPRNDVALRRVINTPRRGIGKTSLDHLTRHAERYDLSLLDAVREVGLIEAIGPRPAASLTRFAGLMDRLFDVAAGPVEEIVGLVLSQSGYHEALRESTDPEDQTRLDNVQELCTAAGEFDRQYDGDAPLEAFLEQTALVNDADAWEDESDRVTLMTLHTAKGLEFPCVYIVALEQGLLPHERSLADPMQLEEERRLLFVGITRAEAQLQLSRAQSRAFRGRAGRTIASSFLGEMPRDQMQLVGAQPQTSFAWDRPVGRAAERPAVVTQSAAATSLQTAAAMLAGDASPADATPIPIEAYCVGMVVMHPEYGLGKVAALSGSSEKRTATVDFAAGAGQRKFRLAQANLRPLSGDT